MNKDIVDIVKDSAFTFLNIAQMTKYRMKYLQGEKDEDKSEMIKYTVLSGFGIACLLTIGIVGFRESRKNCYGL